jgi:predicted porin
MTIKKIILLTVFSANLTLAFAQKGKRDEGKKGDFEVSVSYTKVPINQKESKVDFNYKDGKLPSSVPIDEIMASYNIGNQNYNDAIGIGVSYYVTNKFNLELEAQPQFNSLLSNKGKNGKVYGVQFDLMTNYQQKLIDKLSLTGGLGLSFVLGGYAITSGGPSKKEYLLVSGNRLYDQNIGFHIIDITWATKLEIGLKYELSKRFSVFGNGGYQLEFARNSRMNFAGELSDKTVKWNGKDYSDTDLSLNVNGQRITNNSIQKLPFNFSGLTLQFGISITLDKSE